MKTAHFILTYTNPEQTERLVKRLSHPDFDCYIHLDKKVDMATHVHLANLPNVYFIKNRVDVKWAGYNAVKAVFNAIREICATNIPYNFINFISGQDYPLKAADELSQFYKANVGKEFLSFVDFENEWPEGRLRYEKYYFSNFSFRGRYFLERLINAVTPKRRVPYGFHPYGKSMFWMLSPEVALYVANKVENDAKLHRFFLFSWASDEFVFQTVLMNSNYRDRIVNDNLRYIDWSKGGSHPKNLGVEDYGRIKSSGMLFGRKFDMTRDVEILDLLDTEL